MAADLTTLKARLIRPSYDKRGNPVWHTQMSAPDNSFAQCMMVPDRVIPVVFVPGVMGSNLIQRNTTPDKAVKWRLDNPKTAAAWLTRGAKTRKTYLSPAAMDVDRDGAIPQGTQLPDEELRRRGWGEVAALSYEHSLVWLENALNDFDDPHVGERVRLMQEVLGAELGEARLTRDEVALSYRYRFPVYACGYNWLDDNANSAKRLGQRIEEIIARYRSERKKVEKVIIVTHSMGGLVARYCSEALGYRDKILGIIHGVMPAIGAAAVYRRLKSGTENPHEGIKGSIEGWLGSKALGEDAAEMTAVLSTAPGPLQLLPTPEYGNGWLIIKDGAQEYSLPKQGNPYAEIYTIRGKWWSMCDDALINPLNDEHNQKKRQAQMDEDWRSYAHLISENVRGLHDKLRGRYHPATHAFCGSSNDFKAYGTVKWRSNGGSWLRGDRRSDFLEARHLDPSELSSKRTVAATLEGDGWLKAEQQTYRISEPDEPGDGTVPRRSGVAPRSRCTAFLEVALGHEPAYNHTKGAENLRACRFTLRAIVQIAQQAQHTSLKYE